MEGIALTLHILSFFAFIVVFWVMDAADVMPRAIVATPFANYVLTFVMAVTVFLNLGTERGGVRETGLGQPWIQILANATESKVAANVLTVVVLLMLLFSCINQLTAASRQLWSFARDEGLPFSGWLSYVWLALSHRYLR